eukprot:888903-Pleurochrysis_carterae.AAC.1
MGGTNNGVVESAFLQDAIREWETKTEGGRVLKEVEVNETEVEPVVDVAACGSGSDVAGSTEVDGSVNSMSSDGGGAGGALADGGVGMDIDIEAGRSSGNFGGNSGGNSGDLGRNSGDLGRNSGDLGRNSGDLGEDLDGDFGGNSGRDFGGVSGQSHLGGNSEVGGKGSGNMGEVDSSRVPSAGASAGAAGAAGAVGAT